MGAVRMPLRNLLTVHEGEGLHAWVRPMTMGVLVADFQAVAHAAYRRVHVLLRREGVLINQKKTRRIYRELGLQLRHKNAEAPGQSEAA
jgi:hypothetical protein